MRNTYRQSKRRTCSGFPFCTRRLATRRLLFSSRFQAATHCRSRPGSTRRLRKGTYSSRSRRFATSHGNFGRRIAWLPRKTRPRLTTRPTRRPRASCSWRRQTVSSSTLRVYPKSVSLVGETVPGFGKGPTRTCVEIDLLRLIFVKTSQRAQRV